VLCERSLEHGNDVYICFVDFEKAFDRVNWVKMMEVLKQIQVDWKDRRLISELYMRQQAVIRVADGESEPGVIGRGVRQGCPLSPLLFSIYAEAMMLEAMVEIEEGVRVGGELSKDVRFADDQGMVASTEQGLKKVMDGLNEAAKTYDMKINVKKTKTMVVSREEGRTANIIIDGQNVEQVKKFKYLGAIMTENGTCIEEVKARIGMAKEAFSRTKELVTKGLKKELKKRLVKTLVWSVALYGCETWTMKKEVVDRLNAFEMWGWRRMEKVSWKDKKTNEAIMVSVGEERCFVQAVMKRKKNWIGHVVRGNSLLKLVIEGRMEGKKMRGRPRMGMIDDLKEGSYTEMKRSTEDREKWRAWMPRTCR
jgi:Reverse transcriptase (RNA-dependent DNA polymerase)